MKYFISVEMKNGTIIDFEQDFVVNPVTFFEDNSFSDQVGAAVVEKLSQLKQDSRNVKEIIVN